MSKANYMTKPKIPDGYFRVDHPFAVQEGDMWWFDYGGWRPVKCPPGKPANHSLVYCRPNGGLKRSREEELSAMKQYDYMSDPDYTGVDVPQGYEEIRPPFTVQCGDMFLGHCNNVWLDLWEYRLGRDREITDNCRYCRPLAKKEPKTPDGYFRIEPPFTIEERDMWSLDADGGLENWSLFDSSLLGLLEDDEYPDFFYCRPIKKGEVCS